jgi:hypothetical protein
MISPSKQEPWEQKNNNNNNIALTIRRKLIYLYRCLLEQVEVKEFDFYVFLLLFNTETSIN